MDRNTRIALALAAAPLVAATATATALVLTGAHRRLGAAAARSVRSSRGTTSSPAPTSRTITPSRSPRHPPTSGRGSLSWVRTRPASTRSGARERDRLRIHGVDRIVPEWQHPRWRMPSPSHRRRAPVALVDPPHTLVASSLGGTAPRRWDSTSPGRSTSPRTTPAPACTSGSATAPPGGRATS
jgi:hypothetical protein